MGEYTVLAWKLSDFTGPLADHTNATSTDSAKFVDTSISFGTGAEQVEFTVTDDDDQFEDGYMETGDLSMLAEPLTLDGVTYPADTTNVGPEMWFTTDGPDPITFTVIRFGHSGGNSGENLLILADAPIRPGETYSFAKAGGNPALPYGAICFTPGTCIATPGGPVAVERLRVGDPVWTRDNGAQPIRWIGARRVPAAMMRRVPSLVPVRIAADAFGPGCPARDVVVSPQHRLLRGGARARLYFDAAEVLAPAIGLLDGRGVTRAAPPGGVTYLHLMLDAHDLILADGMWAETLLAGPQARQVLGPAALSEIELLFPGLIDGAACPARPLVAAREAKLLLPAG